MQFTSQARLGLRRFPGSPQLLCNQVRHRSPPLAVAKRPSNAIPFLLEMTNRWPFGAAIRNAPSIFNRYFTFPSPSVLWLSRSEEHTSELQSLMRISYAVFCVKHKQNTQTLTPLTNTPLAYLLLQHKQTEPIT